MSFAAIGHQIQALLRDDYFTVKRLSISTTNNSGVNWRSEGSISNKGVQGSMSFSCANPTGLSLENFSLKTDGRISADGSIRANDSLKFTASVEDGRQEPGRPLTSFGKIGFDFQRPYYALLADVDVVNGPTLRSSGILRRQGLVVGAEVLYNSHLDDKDMSPEVLDANIGVQYTHSDWSMAVRTTELFGNVRVSYHHKVSPCFAAGGLVDYRIKTNYQNLAIGCSWSPDANTAVKAKIDSEAILSLSIQQKMSPVIKTILCSEVDLREMTVDTHKFGVGIIIG